MVGGLFFFSFFSLGGGGVGWVVRFVGGVCVRVSGVVRLVDVYSSSVVRDFLNWSWDGFMIL